mmetsp:Transcript_32458/g.56131  ORF Transcript_32458/g.56131 Transcript_32458/m.56131 type:complete len:568 (+) Transcript_32458:12-1715(+)
MQFGSFACSESGFSMASGKSLAISEEALERARKLFEDSPVKGDVAEAGARDFKSPLELKPTNLQVKTSRQDCGLTSKAKPSQPKVTLMTAIKRKHEDSSQLMTTEPKARRLKYEVPSPYRPPKPFTLLELNRGQSLDLNPDASSHLLNISAKTALDYKFGCPCLIDMDCFCEDKFEIDWRQCINVLGRRKKICTEDWMKRHYRLVVWKYAGIARRISGCGEVFSIKRVLASLEKRYTKEVDNGHRSVLKRVVDGDEFPSCHMVLCVGEIKKVKDAYSVELIDGWNSVSCEIGPADLLYPVVETGKIFEGLKLRVYGAQLEEDRLKLQFNAVRRARWHEKLGKTSRHPFRVNLRSIKMKGGLVPSVCVRVQRVFQPVYYEDVKGNKIITQQSRSEDSRPILLVRVQDVLGDSIPSHKTQVYIRFWKAALGLYNDIRPGDCYVILNLAPGNVNKHGLPVLHYNNHSFMEPSKQPKRPVEPYAQEINLTMTLGAVNKTFRGEVKSLTGTLEDGADVTLEMHNTVYFSMNLTTLTEGSVLLVETVVSSAPHVYMTCDETIIKVKSRKQLAK